MPTKKAINKPPKGTNINTTSNSKEVSKTKTLQNKEKKQHSNDKSISKKNNNAKKKGNKKSTPVKKTDTQELNIKEVIFNLPPLPQKKIKNIPPIKKITHKTESSKTPKIPKLSTTNSVPYVPNYIPIEKREFNIEKSQNIVRYSDTELQEFKNIIYEKMEIAKKELAFLQSFILRKDEMGDDSETGRYITIEDGGAGIERERLAEMASRQIKFIDQLEKALIRIENKTYGICRVTGKLIGKERLRLVPHATLSADAKLGKIK